MLSATKRANTTQIGKHPRRPSLCPAPCEQLHCRSAMVCASIPKSWTRAVRLVSAPGRLRVPADRIVQAGEMQVDAMVSTDIESRQGRPAQPRFRAKLKQAGGRSELRRRSVPSARLVIGTIASIMPMTRKSAARAAHRNPILGHKVIARTSAKMKKPAIITKRGSTGVTSLPTTGDAQETWRRPTRTGSRIQGVVTRGFSSNRRVTGSVRP